MVVSELTFADTDDRETEGQTVLLTNQTITYEFIIKKKQNYCIVSFTCLHGRSLHE